MGKLVSFSGILPPNGGPGSLRCKMFRAGGGGFGCFGGFCDGLLRFGGCWCCGQGW